ncbi:MAG: type II toxin-antitoxin system VapC family toxin [Myxococcota bacterium]|nr:type II toxin-antitoxin system VapC family toxin [Myxococcota bacterium]
MKGRLCLDTSAYSHFRRGAEAAVEAIVAARIVYVPSIVLGELRAGFLAGARAERNERELRRFLAEPIVEVLDVDDDASAAYAEIVVELRRAGTPVPTNDVWIAALAARESATVLTYDRHFEWIRRVASRVLDRP